MSIAVPRPADAEPDSEPSLPEVCQSIWKTTEELLELLRSYSTSRIQEQKDPDALWIDDVTRAQGRTVVAVKDLCDVHPEGVSLKKLAETIGVTPAAASIMVDLLVEKGMIERTRSRNDRRAVLLRLSPQTARLFKICDQSLSQAVMSVAETLGPETVREWERILATASAALRQAVGRKHSPTGRASPPGREGGEPEGST